MASYVLSWLTLYLGWQPRISRQKTSRTKFCCARRWPDEQLGSIGLCYAGIVKRMCLFVLASVKV